MYAKIRVFKTFTDSLWYIVPSELEHTVTPDSWVAITVRNAIKYGIVTHIQSERPELDQAIQLKSIVSVLHVPHDPILMSLAQHIAYLHGIDAVTIHARIYGFLGQDGVKNRVLEPAIERPKVSYFPALTVEQSDAYYTLSSAITQGASRPFVLHGVTGSGKTEIYKRLLVDILHQNKTAIFMVPEVTLALAFEQKFKKELADSMSIFSLHSATTKREKKILWKAILSGMPCIIVGVHLPIFLPLLNLGLIIVDEEHDLGYQEKKHPKFNSRMAAILRAHLSKIPILLGSATPSIHALHGVATRNWPLLTLKNRFAGAFPQIKLVYLPTNTHRKHFWISKELQDAISACLRRKEQVIIFLNRRGYSFFVQCKSCGDCAMCRACSVSLTLHDNDTLLCHYCGYTQKIPAQCLICRDEKPQFIKRGIGTQQLVARLQSLFSKARIGRADLDITKKKTAWQAMLMAFQAKELDIMVGTQTITKGYDFPGVTLVGIIWADMQLHAPHYAATESTIAQLVQVAGRAGRYSKDATVIVQTMQDNPVFQFVNEQSFPQLYEKEYQERKELCYPPCARAILIELYHRQEKIVSDEAEALSKELALAVDDLSLLRILGPSLPVVAKINHVFCRTLLLKSQSFNVIIAAIRKAIISRQWQSSIHQTPLW